MKTIKIKNINNKLGCDGFVHIDVQPKQMISPFAFPIRVLIEEVAHQEGAPVLKFEADVVDVFPIENIKFVPGVFTLCSHGVDLVTFFNELVKSDPECENKKWCVYYYKKVK